MKAPKTNFIARFITFILLVAGLTGCQKVSAPNILFIMTDQQSVNTIGAYGNEICQTPNLDRIAENGMIFMQFASYPWSPSRTTSADYPILGVWFNL